MSLIDDLLVIPPSPATIAQATQVLSDMKDIVTFVTANTLCFDVSDDTLSKIVSIGTSDSVVKMAAIQQKARNIAKALGIKKL